LQKEAVDLARRGDRKEIGAGNESDVGAVEVVKGGWSVVCGADVPQESGGLGKTCRSVRGEEALGVSLGLGANVDSRGRRHQGPVVVLVIDQLCKDCSKELGLVNGAREPGLQGRSHQRTRGDER